MTARQTSELVLALYPSSRGLAFVLFEGAHSGEGDQPFRLKVITDSGDRDHAYHGQEGPA